MYHNCFRETFFYNLRQWIQVRDKDSIAMKICEQNSNSKHSIDR